MTKQTFLHDKHVALGARMVDFAGWHMPVQYSSIIEEHKTVRENVGLFDVSHMGEMIVYGEDALPYLNKLVPQDITKLVDLKAAYCQLTNKQGGIIDDLIIYKLEDNKYLIIANASRIDEDLNWMVRNKTGFNVEIINESHNYSLLAVQGPKACELIKSLGVDELPSFFAIKRGEIFNINLWISRTGYTGEDGVEILVKNEFSEYLWDKLLEAGKEYGIKPIGLGARDTLRLEAALHLYGNDLSEDTTPIEAGLAWSVAKDKTADYNGKKVIMNQLKEGINKKLIGLKMLDKNIARHGYEVYYNNEKIGEITSGGISPVRGDNIALAYIKNLDNLTVGSTIQIMIRDKLHNAEIVKRPFVKKNNKG
ncbi:MAG: glycine cleavage system aminomethyltransferase GcvT [Acinetobacter sp.]|nr:glycine cleavage system aminomethyltransferase GcvT [Acinetobacter sp.]DAB00895.1 MAG TPA: glycine cleavage system protein T [Candidatus Gastranaerophilales bacterium HUM_10]DAB16650.1 MAG TPA: glycine cleavage system protein T [Candidatus Gastranaerophilales bacterium HUM_19]DAB19434.1 MAG TPA: glycine cleavage system protein T [Candidatus Gastranaerophilales bacterium HUM_17]